MNGIPNDMSAIDDLLAEIFDGAKPVFYSEFVEWMRDSRRFRSFAGDYRAKIRSKLRQIQNLDNALDLRAELETAALLLRDDRFTLEYEKFAATRQRAPDFTVTFKTHTPFNVEVRRIRPLHGEDADARAAKLVGVLCDKVEQMPSGVVNLLWLTGEAALSSEDVTRAAVTLRGLAERKNEEFFTRRGFESAAEFLKHYSRLSGIVLHKPGEGIVWNNPLARHKAPPEITSAIQRLD
ncbi:MAG: hypothetical protein IAE80_22440 [Anaerolinea sp.]|nr:hypothetical protein [Anaerolinea sp.]